MAPRTRRKAHSNRHQRVTDRDPQLLRRIYEVMVLTRAVEDRMVAMYRGGDLLGSFYSGHWHEAISVGCGLHAAPRRLPRPDPPRPGRAPVARHGALAGDGELHGQGHLADGWARRHAALRAARPQHLQPAQPHPGQLPGGHRHGVRREVPRRGPGVPGVLRRRLHLAGRLPRGAHARERAEAAERLRDREQPVRLLDTAAADLELGDVRRSRPSRTGSRVSRWTAPTRWPCTTRWPRRSRGPGRATGRRSSRASRCACTATPSTTRPTTWSRSSTRSTRRRTRSSCSRTCCSRRACIDDDTVKQVREETRQVAIAARRKSLADPMPDPSNIEDGVYAD